MIEAWRQESALTDFFAVLREKAEAKTAKGAPEDRKKALAKVAPKVWIENAALKASGIEYTTHPVKLTNPSAGTQADPSDVTNILYEGGFVNNGLLNAGNATVDVDASTNAALLPVLKFLELRLSDERRLIEHFIENSEVAKDLLNQCENPEEVRRQFIDTTIGSNGSMHSTSNHLPQVYFPVDGDYHLLTVLRNSTVLFELKRRINLHLYSDEAKVARNARFNREAGAKHIQVNNLTGIGFGGTQPQNISNLNSQNAGVAYLLDSRPPTIKFSKNVRIPQKDFFHEFVQVAPSLLVSFHNMAQASKYVKSIFDWRDDVLRAVFEQIIKAAYLLRAEKGGWSRFVELPLNQKALLDTDIMTDDSIDLNEMRTEFALGSVDWFVNAYRLKFGNDAVEIGPAEREYILNQFIKVGEEALA